MRWVLLPLGCRYFEEAYLDIAVVQPNHLDAFAEWPVGRCVSDVYSGVVGEIGVMVMTPPQADAKPTDAGVFTCVFP